MRKAPIFFRRIPDLSADQKSSLSPWKKNLYLTFDDGPDPEMTPLVLDLLKAHHARATFFLVAERAMRHPEIVRRICAEGHSVGNHSYDHSYLPFFQGAQMIKEWIQSAEGVLTDLTGHPSVGFRSPAGVRTPPLHAALFDLRMPLIHWNVRFYDSLWRWSESAAKRSIETIESGSIVLLHDRQRPGHRQAFLNTLRHYLLGAKSQGFHCKSIGKELLRLPSL